jgi:hypothetical protein
LTDGGGAAGRLPGTRRLASTSAGLVVIDFMWRRAQVALVGEDGWFRASWDEYVDPTETAGAVRSRSACCTRPG